MLEVRNLFTHYDRFAVLHDVGFDLPVGRFLGIVGRNGVGKTTLLKLLGGYLKPSEGSIFLNNTNITSMDPGIRNIGMVFQNYALFPHMTVGENLAFPLEVRGMGKSERDAKVTRALDMVQMGAFLNRRIGRRGQHLAHAGTILGHHGQPGRLRLRGVAIEVADRHHFPWPARGVLAGRREHDRRVVVHVSVLVIGVIRHGQSATDIHVRDVVTLSAGGGDGREQTRQRVAHRVGVADLRAEVHPQPP